MTYVTFAGFHGYLSSFSGIFDLSYPRALRFGSSDAETTIYNLPFGADFQFVLTEDDPDVSCSNTMSTGTVGYGNITGIVINCRD